MKHCGREVNRFFNATLPIPKAQRFKAREKVAERQGDSTMQSGNVENVGVAVFTDTAISADSAISAVFSQILEQILEQMGGECNL